MGKRLEATYSRGDAADPFWLLLLYQLPLKPSKLRVRTWRRLQKLGALQVRGSAYMLPNSPQAREDFEWIRTEVTSMKGEAIVFTADAGDAGAHDEIVARFQATRAKDYQALRSEIQKALDAGRQPGPRGPRDRRWKSVAKALRDRWNEVAAVDFLAAPGRYEAQSALEELERLPIPTGSRARRSPPTGGILMPAKYRNRLWLTRPRPGVDRMSSAWLIRRFIDPKARFAFGEKPRGGGKSIPFDMYGIEFGHRGDACTFETLVSRFGIKDRAVQNIARIVHDLDLKDDKFQPPDVVAVGRLVEGLRQMYRSDAQLLREGMKMFEALYRSLMDMSIAHSKRTVKPR
jgi:hypothetical protein